VIATLRSSIETRRFAWTLALLSHVSNCDRTVDGGALAVAGLATASVCRVVTTGLGACCGQPPCSHRAGVCPRSGLRERVPVPPLMQDYDLCSGGSAIMSVVSATLRSERVASVLERIRVIGAAEDEQGKLRVRSREAQLGQKIYGVERARLYGRAPLSVAPVVGELLYVLTRAARPTMAVEFGASLGYSTIHIASALRDLGHGSLITTELSAEKALEARQNLDDAGVADLVDLRVGDAMKTLMDIKQDVSMLFLDGWNDLYLPLLTQLEPLLSAGAFVIADMSNGDPHHDRYRQHVNDSANGYTSFELPLDAGVVISIR
jgi:predicted O-methyltransferase YrrM